MHFYRTAEDCTRIEFSVFSGCQSRSAQLFRMLSANGAPLVFRVMPIYDDLMAFLEFT